MELKWLVSVAIVCACVSFASSQVKSELNIEVIIICIEILSFFQQNELVEDEVSNWLDQITQECAVEEGATQSDIDEALAFELPSTQVGRCFHACLGEKSGIVSSLMI